MELHDPYRASVPSAAPEGPVKPLDMSGVSFNSDGRVSSAATIAAGYTSSIIAARWLATLIDFAALALIIGVPLMTLGETVAKQATWLWTTLLVAYFPVMETRFGGSLGKLATGTRVVNIRGERPAWWQSIVRTALRLIEVNPFLFGAIPAGLVALMSSNRQRIGDMLARTYVLRRADIARIRTTGTAQVAGPVVSQAAMPVPPPLPPSPLPLPEDDNARWARPARD
ncbi:RDD family protein [Stenotrophomonas sp. LGBM10]|uniref:RDD family protein n=1 Tax=Stenotrophomonas sp. LGBM10 TaxID=3390038 RepID=UPI00398B8E29